MNKLLKPTLAAYQLNGEQVDAQLFYDIACDPRRSVAVEACAGAGKTWMLIERIVKALEQGAKPDEILAITFTRKAAGEMRERLQEILNKPERQALRAQVLAANRSVQISTFHAWFGQLLGAAPMAVLSKLGLPLAYQLLEDETVLLPELRLAFYRSVAKDTVLRGDLQALISDLGRSKVEDAFANLLAKRIEFELTDQEGLLETSVHSALDLYPAYAPAIQSNQDDDWICAKPDKYELLQSVAKALGQYQTNELKKAANKLEVGLTKSNLGDVQQSLLTQKLEPRRFNSTISDADRSMLEEAQAYLVEMLAVQHQHRCWLYQQRMTRLGRVWIAEFTKLKYQRESVDMSDLERAATTLLSDFELSGAIQERLDLKLRHVLIDEFQDTNPLQWQAMHAWLSSYAGSGGGQTRPSLFIVGDPKQSIYRFRRAEPRVFVAAQAFMQESFDAALLACDHTRRNAQAVLSVVNTAMQNAVSNAEYSNFRLHTTTSAQAGAALCLPLIARDAKATKSKKSQPAIDSRNHLTTPREDAEEALKTKEAEQAACWIASLQERGAPSVMMLARRHHSLDLMQQALHRQGIAATKQEKNFLADIPAVQDLLALINVLVSPQNDLDLARALKSPLFAWSDAQLMALRVSQLALLPEKKSWFELLSLTLKSKLERWQTWLNRLPPHDALQAIYDDGQVLFCYPADQSALQALLWAALEVAGGRFLTAHAFVRAMRAQVQSIKAPALVALDDVQSVQLLTIHGAKGLQADVVLLLDSDSEPRKSQSMATLVDWQPEHPAPRKFVFLLSESYPPICVATLLAEDMKAREIEELNTLYVACTRAKQILVISATEAHITNPKSLWQRLNGLCAPAELPSLPVNHALKASTSSARTNIHAIKALPSTVLTLPVFPPALALESLKTNESAQIGRALHRLLQWLPTDEGHVERNWYEHELQAVQREFDLSNQALSQAHGMAKTIANGEAAWLWDTNYIDWQANEYELIFNGRVHRIDRLIKRRDTQNWWVIDFKSAAHPEYFDSLRQQLDEYVQAIGASFGIPQTAIKGVFVTGLGKLSMGR